MGLFDRPSSTPWPQNMVRTRPSDGESQDESPRRGWVWGDCKWPAPSVDFEQWVFFPTCQVRVVRFYVSCLLLLPPPPASSSSPPPPLLLVLLVLLVILVVLVVLVVLVQLRPAIHSVPCRTSTTTIHAQCSLPDLNHDQPRPVFPAGPQPRPATPSVPCRTSTASIHAKCSLPDLM